MDNVERPVLDFLNGAKITNVYDHENWLKLSFDNGVEISIFDGKLETVHKHSAGNLFRVFGNSDIIENLSEIERLLKIASSKCHPSLAEAIPELGKAKSLAHSTWKGIVENVTAEKSD